MATAIPSPLPILKSTQTTGPEFIVPGGLTIISLENHAGGTWRLQYSPNDGADWFDYKGDANDDAMTWDSKAQRIFVGTHQYRYRLTGGSAGAVAWAAVPGTVDTEVGSRLRAVPTGGRA